MLTIFREKDAKRKAYTVLVERVFRREALNEDKVLGKSDLDAMEKEISIDIAELKRDLKRFSTTMDERLTNIMKDSNLEKHKDKCDAQTLTQNNEDISIRRNSSRQRKKSILNEASYLANRLSKALSNSNILTADEKECGNENCSIKRFCDKKRDNSSK